MSSGKRSVVAYALRVLGCQSTCGDGPRFLVAAVPVRRYRQEGQPEAYPILLRLVFFAAERCAVMNETDFSEI